MVDHLCIKPGCGNKYQDNDVDAYYCSRCNEERKTVAMEIDKKVFSRPRKNPKSDLQIFDEIRKQKGVNFVNIKDLGIKF